MYTTLDKKELLDLRRIQCPYSLCKEIQQELVRMHLPLPL